MLHAVRMLEAKLDITSLDAQRQLKDVGELDDAEMEMTQEEKDEMAAMDREMAEAAAKFEAEEKAEADGSGVVGEQQERGGERAARTRRSSVVKGWAAGDAKWGDTLFGQEKPFTSSFGLRAMGTMVPTAATSVSPVLQRVPTHVSRVPTRGEQWVRSGRPT